ncbi:hypothetical protein AIOL_003132 [Candidatus Rhodobacter oscarellae]|uniref:Integral membrane protein n=1 Tax=Candidatus Rhodobacter oscarellae TaxID=1675527 RepID=A0A0J9E679_9RHOB|nr:DUF1036 domain-containing protein [Candidatus Rhodobacter lobularis]KMW58161.1 hypothetical protein AIOL_003132 [Candidatus Rhodobacter lobularis]
MPWRTLAGAALAALLATALPAVAGLTVCNETGLRQSVALGYKGERDWSSKGWWNIPPGDCVLVVAGDLTKRYYYYRAESATGDFRGQDFRFCTRAASFEIAGDTECAQRGFEAQRFREIDTGEAATSFTLTLVAKQEHARSGAAKTPDAEATGLTTQRLSKLPAAPDLGVNTASLKSALPPGRHGEAATLSGVFQGCELERSRSYCSLHAGGTKYRAFYGGPTPEDMLLALEAMPVGIEVTVALDLVERSGRERAVVLRSVATSTKPSPFAALRARIQGDWVSASDPRSEITLHGSEIYARYGGDFSAVRFFELAAECRAGDGARGPVMRQRTIGDARAACFSVLHGAGRLDLVPLSGGAPQRYKRRDPARR